MLLGFYREFLRGHMAESFRAPVLACLALVCINECIFGMSHSFQYINYYGKRPFKVWFQSFIYLIKYFSNYFLVFSSVLYQQKFFMTSISVSNLLIFCVFMIIFCFFLPAEKIREHSSKIVGDSPRPPPPPCRNGR